MRQKSDALVFFGATGDLARKQIFPALQALVRRGGIDLPIIGVARTAMDLDGFRDFARQSLQEHGGVDDAAFARLAVRLRYVNGDYNEASGTLSFSAGTTVRTISVQVRGDREVEPDETFYVELTSAQKAIVVDGPARATILNDD